MMSAMASGLLTVAVLAGVAFMWPRPLGGNVTYVKVSGQSMEPRLHSGDLVVVRRHSTYRVGDVVAYRIPRGQFAAGLIVIHRIISISPDHRFRTQGDARARPDAWTPGPGDVVGVQWLVIGGIGTDVERFDTPFVLAGVLGLVAASGAFGLVTRAERRDSRSDRRNSTLASPRA